MRIGTETQMTARQNGRSLSESASSIDIQICLIRHGKTKGNEEHRYIGITDEPLSESGKQILLDNCERYPKADLLFVSPMKRCLETAEIIYPQLQAAAIKEWREMDFGLFEGRNYKELMQDRSMINLGERACAQMTVCECYQKWIDSNGSLPFPHGESKEMFIFRCVQGFEKMAEHICGQEGTGGAQPKTAALVVHGGTIMALLSSYCGGAYFDYQAANGEGYRCRLECEKGKISLSNIKKLTIKRA